MTINEASQRAKELGLYEVATTLVATSNGQFIIDGDLAKVKSQADKDGYEVFVLKGELPPLDKTKDATSGTQI